MAKRPIRGSQWMCLPKIYRQGAAYARYISQYSNSPLPESDPSHNKASETPAGRCTNDTGSRTKIRSLVSILVSSMRKAAEQLPGAKFKSRRRIHAQQLRKKAAIAKLLAEIRAKAKQTTSEKRPRPSYDWDLQHRKNYAFTELLRRLDTHLGRVSGAINSQTKAIDVHLQSIVKATSNVHDVKPIDVPDQPPIPRLAHGLDCVLFDPGVRFLKDPRTNHYNFDRRLKDNVNITEFDFKRLPSFVSASKDQKLAQIAKEIGARYTASTSGMTGILSQFHYAISCFRTPQAMSLSKFFEDRLPSFSSFQTMPNIGTLNKDSETSLWALGSALETFTPGILSHLGQAMEVMLVNDHQELKKYLKDSKEKPKSADKHTYAYTQVHDVLIRSQLDCYDPRLPGTGSFDLKTRAVCAVRHDMDYAQTVGGSDYQIRKIDGVFESYNREYFELIRSALFKYSLQARMGRMDGIFVAYHNIKQLFGFQYLPLEEIDKIYHSSHLVHQNPGNIYRLSQDVESKMGLVASIIAEKEYRHSVKLLTGLLDLVLKDQPPQATALTYMVHSPEPNQLVFIVAPAANESYDTTDIAEAEATTAAEDPELAISLDVPGAAEELKKKSVRNPFLTKRGTEMPEGTAVYQCTFSSEVNGLVLGSEESPALVSKDDEWNIHMAVSRIHNDFAEHIYHRTKSKFKSMNLVSKPILDSPPLDEKTRKFILASLPKPTAMQKVLRSFSDQRKIYW